MASSRSQAARKGWETRRAKLRQAELAYQRRSLAAKKGWETRKLTWARHRAIGPMGLFLHGKASDDRVVLRTLIDQNDSRWITFLTAATQAGFSPAEARNAWFSPKAKPSSKLISELAAIAIKYPGMAQAVAARRKR